MLKVLRNKGEMKKGRTIQINEARAISYWYRENETSVLRYQIGSLLYPFGSIIL